MLRSARFLFGAATVLFLLAPLIAILPLAFTSSSMLTYPITALSPRWFEELATADAWRRSIVNSLITNGGTLRAQGISQHNGHIIIGADGSNKTAKSGSSWIALPVQAEHPSITRP